MAREERFARVRPAGSAGEGLSRTLSMVGERVQEIVDSAERVAEEIRAEAEAEAATYLRERRDEADRLVEQGARELAERMHALSERTERLWRETTEISAEFGQVTARLQGQDVRRADGPDPGRFESPQEPDRRHAPGEAVLRATQLAVAGRNREEIRAALDLEFAVADAGALADEVLGLTGGAGR